MDNDSNALLITDVFWMALIKAVNGKMPDKYNDIEINKSKKKIQAVYLDKTGLPVLSLARIQINDQEISLNDFRFAYFEIKDKLFEILKERANQGSAHQLSQAINN